MLTIRPRRLEDDPRTLEIFHQYENVFVMTLEALRFHLDGRARPGGLKPVMRVAELDGRIVGDWYFEPSSWSSNPGVFYAMLEVDLSHRGQGIGTRLWEDLRAVSQRPTGGQGLHPHRRELA